MDSTTRDALLERLNFYRDLGITEFFRRSVDPALQARLDAVPAAPPLSVTPQPVEPQMSRAPSFPLVSAENEEKHEAPPASQPNFFLEEPPIPSRKPSPVLPPASEAMPPAERAAALQIIRDEIGDCTRCVLHEGRHNLVFGDGDAAARLLFVGEGPGADEDAQGIPFVGRAGQLLNNMITAMGLKREEVYIANVVKCRPPGNRTPNPDESAICSPFLFRQIDVIHPEVIVALGATAAACLLGTHQPLAASRHRVHSFRGAKLIITYHPAYLLRDPRQKKEAWADLQIAMHELGLKLPKKG
jgi:DNA polymerase